MAGKEGTRFFSLLAYINSALESELLRNMENYYQLLIMKEDGYMPFLNIISHLFHFSALFQSYSPL